MYTNAYKILVSHHTSPYRANLPFLCAFPFVCSTFQFQKRYLKMIGQLNLHTQTDKNKCIPQQYVIFCIAKRSIQQQHNW